MPALPALPLLPPVAEPPLPLAPPLPEPLLELQAVAKASPATNDNAPTMSFFDISLFPYDDGTEVTVTNGW